MFSSSIVRFGTCLALLAAPGLAAAQTANIPLTEVSAQVVNTGCDQFTVSGRELSAFVWDGDQSTTGNGCILMCGFRSSAGNANLTLSDKIPFGNTTGVASDPDVVITRNPGTSTWTISTVYQVDYPLTSAPSEVWTQVWEYTETTDQVGVLTPATTLPTKVSLSIGAARHPNIDVTTNGTASKAVITFVQATTGTVYNDIVGCVQSLSGTFPITRRAVVSNPSGTTSVMRRDGNSQPDVSVQDNGSSPMVNFVYTYKSSSINQVTSSVVNLTTLESVPTGTTLYVPPVSGTGTISSRVAVNTSPTLTLSDVVEHPRVTYSAANQYFYLTFKRSIAATNQTSIRVNQHPVTSGTYTGERTLETLAGDPSIAVSTPAVAPTLATNTGFPTVMVIWVETGYAQSIIKQAEVPAGTTAYTGSGTPIRSFVSVPDYRAPSICKASYGADIYPLGYDLLYFWKDSDSQNGPSLAYMFTHSVGSSSRPARTGNDKNRLTVMPNPATMASAIQVDLAPGEKVLSLTVTSVLTGRVVTTVATDRPLSKLSLGNLLPPATPAGLYSARLLTSHGVSTKLFRLEQ